MWTPLVVGARLVIARPGGHVDPEYIADTLAGQGVTFFNTGAAGREESEEDARDMRGRPLTCLSPLLLLPSMLLLFVAAASAAAAASVTGAAGDHPPQHLWVQPGATPLVPLWLLACSAPIRASATCGAACSPASGEAHAAAPLCRAVPALGLEYYKCPAVRGCTSLRAACFAGEAMPLELVELIYRNVPQGVTVVNAYGEQLQLDFSVAALDALGAVVEGIRRVA